MDNLKSHIGKLREDFMKGTLTENEVDQDPSFQFKTWLGQAIDAQVPEAHAMNLATVSFDLRPSSRIVYLREFENNCFNFYTNYNSRKANDLNANPNGALTFFWPELERQIRIEGTIAKVSPSQSDTYYNTRPYESKVGAWASRQSAVLRSREELEKKVQNFKLLLSPETIARPEFWGGYALKGNYYEFWQGRKSRLHDRIIYTLEDAKWRISRLSP